MVVGTLTTFVKITVALVFLVKTAAPQQQGRCSAALTCPPSGGQANKTFCCSTSIRPSAGEFYCCDRDQYWHNWGASATMFPRPERIIAEKVSVSDDGMLIQYDTEGGTDRDFTVELKFWDNTEKKIILDGKSNNNDADQELIVTDPAKLNEIPVEYVVLSRRSQYIQGMIFDCNGQRSLRCGDSGSARTSDFKQKLMNSHWYNGTSLGCGDPAWCMCKGQSCIQPPFGLLNCARTPQRCGTRVGGVAEYSCSSTLALMNPPCEKKGCIGHKEKVSAMKMYQPNTGDCTMDKVHFKLRMKLMEQDENPDHNVTVVFRKSGYINKNFKVEIEFTNCGAHGNKQGCKVKVHYVQSAKVDPPSTTAAPTTTAAETTTAASGAQTTTAVSGAQTTDAPETTTTAAPTCFSNPLVNTPTQCSWGLLVAGFG